MKTVLYAKACIGFRQFSSGYLWSSTDERILTLAMVQDQKSFGAACLQRLAHR
jgi:hypothetical protein